MAHGLNLIGRTGAIVRAAGIDEEQIERLLHQPQEPTRPNWWILGGSLVFVIFTVTMGLAEVPYNQEIIFAGSMLIVGFLINRLLQVLEPAARNVLLGTAIIIFVYRAMPTPGAGQTWWMIDQLGFDQRFLSILSLISSSLALFGMFLFRRFMAERSIAYVVTFLTLVGTFLYMPVIGMYYGLHEWTASLTNGVVDARFIALVDTALESPLGQVAMIPMLAWIANSAPAQLKATFFAVMASFTNLALSASTASTRARRPALRRTRRAAARSRRPGFGWGATSRSSPMTTNSATSPTARRCRSSPPRGRRCIMQVSVPPKCCCNSSRSLMAHR